MKILLIIPAYNEERSLPALLEEVKFAELDAVIVDDASHDNTASVALAAGFPVLQLVTKLGIGGAVQTGFIYAVQHGYDIAVHVDGDGRHNPALVRELVDPIVAGEADCVIGSRYLPADPGRDRQTPVNRRLGEYFSTSILRWGTGLQIYDTNSGFRALNRKAFTFFSTEYPVDHPEAEALLLLHRAGFRIIEIPARMRGQERRPSLFASAKALFYPVSVIIGLAGIILKQPRGKI
ncbi:MAG: glycosyltransferase family 2 protein [Deltaproteobacteria bacterium]|nr:glycosyltransferase family 2 protein [Deltaproteobacteria bacterium]